MQIKVEKQKLIAEFQKTLDKIKQKKKEAMKIYFKKLTEYETYIQKRIKLQKIVKQYPPPAPPVSLSEEVEAAIYALTCHTEEAVNIDSRELYSLRNALHDSYRTLGQSVNTLSSLNYMETEG